jgi:hypothetical protein
MKIGSLLLAGVVSLCYGSTAIALEPTTIDYNSRTDWSNPTSNEFDGSVVHDRHEVDGYQIVSSWSKRGIRLTLARTFSKIEGYKAVETCKDTEKGEKRCEFKNEPIQKQFTQKYRAAEMVISINNKLYRYSQGPVSWGLAKALAKAPLDKNAKIRISLADSSVESEIGTGTVRAWRKIFK